MLHHVSKNIANAASRSFGFVAPEKQEVGFRTDGSQSQHLCDYPSWNGTCEDCQSRAEALTQTTPDKKGEEASRVMNHLGEHVTYNKRR